MGNSPWAAASLKAHPPALTWGPPWAAVGDSLSHHAPLRRLQGNLRSGAWSTSSPSFFTDLWCLQSCFSRISVTSLTAAAQCFLPFLKYVFTEAPPAPQMGLALASSGSIAEPSRTNCVRHGTAPSLISQRLPPPTPTPTPHYQILAT